MNGRGTVRRGRARVAAALVAAVVTGLTGSAVAMTRSDVEAASAAGVTAEGLGGTTLFRDYFNVSPDPAWTFYNRAGQVAGGRLVVDGDYLPGAGAIRDGWVMTHVGATKWRNYVFTTTYDTANVGGSPSDVHMAFVYFRVVDAGQRTGGTYYRLALWDPEQASPQGSGGNLPTGLVILERYNNGVPTLLADRKVSNTVTGGNQVEVRVTGPRIEVKANGSVVVSVVDPKPIRYGGVGVGQIWETNGAFDNVTVRSVYP